MCDNVVILALNSLIIKQLEYMNSQFLEVVTDLGETLNLTKCPKKGRGIYKSISLTSEMGDDYTVEMSGIEIYRGVDKIKAGVVKTTYHKMWKDKIWDIEVSKDYKRLVGNCDLYIIKCPSQNIIKIGMSRMLENRIQALKYPFNHDNELVIRVNNVPPRVEKSLHRLFKNSLCKGREWFNITEEVQLFLDNPLPILIQLIEK